MGLVDVVNWPGLPVAELAVNIVAPPAVGFTLIRHATGKALTSVNHSPLVPARNKYWRHAIRPRSITKAAGLAVTPTGGVTVGRHSACVAGARSDQGPLMTA